MRMMDEDIVVNTRALKEILKEKNKEIARLTCQLEFSEMCGETAIACTEIEMIRLLGQIKQLKMEIKDRHDTPMITKPACLGNIDKCEECSCVWTLECSARSLKLKKDASITKMGERETCQDDAGYIHDKKTGDVIGCLWDDDTNDPGSINKPEETTWDGKRTCCRCRKRIVESEIVWEPDNGQFFIRGFCSQECLDNKDTPAQEKPDEKKNETCSNCGKQEFCCGSMWQHCNEWVTLPVTPKPISLPRASEGPMLGNRTHDTPKPVETAKKTTKPEIDP